MVVAVEGESGEAWDAALATLRERLAPRFSRAEPRRRARAYLAGLVGTAARKNGWQLAEDVGEATPYGMQRLLAGAKWEAEAVRDDLRAFVVERLGDAAGVLIVDGTGFLKQGRRDDEAILLSTVEYQPPLHAIWVDEASYQHHGIEDGPMHRSRVQLRPPGRSPH